MDQISSKVVAGSTTAAAAGTPLAVCIIWAIGQTGWQMPPEVATAFGSLIAAGVGFVGGWLKTELKLNPPAGGGS